MKALRAQKGWSQEELAFESGLHRTYISDLERCARNPSISIVEKLAEGFGVDPVELIKR
ncbi:MAG: helix-turn-helix domain-containing protein [Alphaproteobacteria bacterium]